MNEAEALVSRDGLEKRISFHKGNAEALPFPDNHFDVVFSITVMEEVNADAMLAEMIRVAKPAGRIGVIVRATDIPYTINIPVGSELKERFQSPQRRDEGEGTSSISLYRRFLQSPLQDVVYGPQLPIFREANDVVERFLQAGFLTNLTDADANAWRAATRKKLQMTLPFF